VNGRTFKAFAPPLALMGIIFSLSSIPGVPVDGSLNFLMTLEPGMQNLLHVPLWGLLQLLWLRGFAQIGKRGFLIVLACLTITVGYGFLDEFHQTFVPGRYGGLSDFVLDVVGAVVGIACFSIYVKILKLRGLDADERR